LAVQLGAHVGQQNLPMAELRALWRRLDGAGLDWISVWDHLYEVPPAGGTQPHFEAIATLGALAADTTTARIGCLVFYVGYRNPALLARAATTLDHISGGRFELGLGSGWAELEAHAHGYDFPALRERMDMLEEAVPLIRSLLTHDRTSHAGEFFRTDDLTMLPGPARGHLPIWVGGIGEKRTLRIAARHADGWNAPYVSPEEFRRLNGVLDRWCEIEGRDPASIERTVNLMFHLSTDASSAARVEAELTDKWGDMAERVMGGALLGTPDDAVARLGEYVAAGAQGINVALRAPLDDEALTAYLDVVIPAVRAASGG
jgi:alkanesulfonate monooxygenase SsuD/methylene tetrahydromethanopterin reductase-like flavin-dependent oxidoreductase (luciferase family)